MLACPAKDAVMSSVVSSLVFFFFFNDTATTEIYTLSLHDALPVAGQRQRIGAVVITDGDVGAGEEAAGELRRSIEHEQMIVGAAGLVRREGSAGDLDRGAVVIASVIAAGERGRNRDRGSLLERMCALTGERENRQLVPDRRARMGAVAGRRTERALELVERVARHQAVERLSVRAELIDHQVVGVRGRIVRIPAAAGRIEESQRDVELLRGRIERQASRNPAADVEIIQV